MSKFSAPHITLAGAFALPVLILALTGCTGSQPSSTPSSEGTSQNQPAESSPTDEADSSPADEADSNAAAEEVIAVGLKFMPADLTVKAGTTVRWTNGEAISHTVTSGAWGDVNEDSGLRGSQNADGMFDHALAPMGSDGDTFEFTFDEPGEYQYFCKPHLGMVGTITVE